MALCGSCNFYRSKTAVLSDVHIKAFRPYPDYIQAKDHAINRI